MLLRSYIAGFAIWCFCVFPLVLYLVARRSHLWEFRDLRAGIALAVCGIIVVGIAARICTHFGKTGALIVGFFVGQLPSALLIGWLIVSHPGFEAGPAFIVWASILVLPSGIGGALSGFLCRRADSQIGRR
jgi:hypothetical protein